MKYYNNRILALTAALAIAAWAGPAAATLELFVDVDKTKTVDVTITIDITKFVDVTVTLMETFDGDAQALANANIVTRGNSVGPCQESCDNLPRTTPDFFGGDRPWMGLDYDAQILDSINDNTGIVNANQDVGNFSNQGNVLSVSRTEFIGAGEFASVVHSEASVDQENTGNSVGHSELIVVMDGETEEELITRIFDEANADADIDGSINDNDGLVGVNQNAGNMNNQTHAMAFAYSETAGVALSEADLGQVNANNTVLGVETAKIDTMSASLQNNEGVIRVNQSVGNMNNQSSSVSFSALRSTLSVTVPFAN